MLNTPFANVSIYIVAWALQIVSSKLGFLAGASLFTFTFQSYIFACILLSFFVLPRKLREIRKLPMRVLCLILLGNVIHLGVGGLLGQAGIQLTSAINAGFLMQFTTVSTTILAWIFLKEKMNISKVIIIFMILFGTFLLVTKGQALNKIAIGDILIVLACIAWSTSSIFVRKTLKNTTIHPDVISFFRPIAGIPFLVFFLLFAPFYPASIKNSFQLNLFDFRFVPFVILNGFFCALLWVFSTRTLKVSSASYLTMMNSATPVLVAFLAILFLKETINTVQFFGATLIVSSNVFTQYLKVAKH